jgi:ABC-type transport system involved in cytochrome c biogenesis ATPase subunit
LKVAGIYGANAAGKTTLVEALALLQRMVLSSVGELAQDKLPDEAFRPAASRVPTTLEVVAWIGQRQARYGMELVPNGVVKEWLYRSGDDGDEVLGFLRQGDRYETGPGWTRDPVLEARTRPQALHVSVAGQFNHPEATELVDWVRNLQIWRSEGGPPGATRGHTLKRLAGDRSRVVDMMKLVDSTIDDIEVERPEAALDLGAPSSRAAHSTPISILRRGHAYPLEQESAGTQRFLSLTGPILTCLEQGLVLVIDDLDARLHTLLSRTLLELFLRDDLNPKGAQLIFTSHDTHLFARSTLRRDQIWFVEKNPASLATELYSLAEFRDGGRRVRNDASYEQDYLLGRYGAVPFFGGALALLARCAPSEAGAP